jgi:hypothetical protein
LIKRYLHCMKRRSKTVRPKDALSAGASSKIIRPTGEELYTRYIWWSIIGGVRYLSKNKIYYYY